MTTARVVTTIYVFASFARVYMVIRTSEATFTPCIVDDPCGRHGARERPSWGTGAVVMGWGHHEMGSSCNGVYETTHQSVIIASIYVEEKEERICLNNIKRCKALEISCQKISRTGTLLNRRLPR